MAEQKARDASVERRRKEAAKRRAKRKQLKHKKFIQKIDIDDSDEFD